jgi:hypothetical protein
LEASASLTSQAISAGYSGLDIVRPNV